MAIDLVAVDGDPTKPRSAPLAVGLLLAVATVLADSSVVVLALPDVLSSFDVSIERVSWVITGFNLVLALAAVPAAYLATRAGANGVAAAGPRRLRARLGGLHRGRELRPAARRALRPGGERRGRRVRGAADPAGACSARRRAGWPAWAARRGDRGGGRAGRRRRPDAGVHVAGRVRRPGAARARAAAASGARARPHARRASRWRARAPRLAPNLALALVSAALTAALFLLVLELVRGWGLVPLAAAAVLTVIPAAALATAAARPVGPGCGRPARRPG